MDLGYCKCHILILLSNSIVTAVSTLDVFKHCVVYLRSVSCFAVLHRVCFFSSINGRNVVGVLGGSIYQSDLLSLTVSTGYP